MKRILGAALAGAVLLGSGGVATAAPQAEFHVAPIDWKPCDKAPQTDCGTLTLPIDYKRPDGDKFGLAVARHRATNPAKRIGTLVTARYTGESGVDFAANPGQYFSPAITERFDIIGFDARGNERSQPIMCSQDLLRQWPSGYPKNEQQFNQVIDFNKKLRDDCRQRSGPIFDHASSAETARDVDAIRRALGEKKISFFGKVDGTIIGQQYAERYGDKLRAMVLDTSHDHSMGTRQYLASAARAAADLFAEWTKWNDRTPSSPLYGKDVAKFWDDLAATADSVGLVDPRYPDYLLDWQVLSAGFLGELIDGDFQRLTTWALSLRPSQQAPQTPPATGKAINYPFLAVICNNYNYRHNSFAQYQRLSALENSIAPHTRGLFHPHNNVIECSGYPKATNPQRPLRIHGAPKILVTNVKHAVWSSKEWAEAVHSQTRGTTVLATYEGVSEGFYESNDCTRAVNDSYLLDLKVPANGTTCAAAAGQVSVTGVGQPSTKAASHASALGRGNH